MVDRIFLFYFFYPYREPLKCSGLTKVQNPSPYSSLLQSSPSCLLPHRLLALVYEEQKLIETFLVRREGEGDDANWNGMICRK